MIMSRLGSIMLIATMTALAGCNTVSGVGQDIYIGANFVQGYMPPEMQAPPDRATIGGSGIPSLGSM